VSGKSVWSGCATRLFLNLNSSSRHTNLDLLLKAGTKTTIGL